MRDGRSPASFTQRAAMTDETSPCWLSSTPRPISLSPFTTSEYGSESQSDSSPGGTMSMWDMIQNERSDARPGTVRRRFGRSPFGTRGSGAGSDSQVPRPSRETQRARTCAFSHSPVPPFCGARAGTAVRSRCISMIWSRFSSTRVRSVSRSSIRSSPVVYTAFSGRRQLGPAGSAGRVPLE